jgi:hypothetical protein
MFVPFVNAIRYGMKNLIDTNANLQSEDTQRIPKVDLRASMLWAPTNADSAMISFQKW